ncbi:FAD/NAD(P)-binding domain-containing protein [Macrolepiota fuliginosa MF-IS2]|uniref:FAD/NAD(P)-binding domain-containing protein n=1 Tax=Macrolepiota fuliginosa MF-IS2 TaxID=1400762 RepID=A0A9P6C1A0_9AGAR|nr:FAD/NAD(P)-binding domain-containing protein [Macrolepiota fuliginosa MF-IS2]
MPTAAHPDSSNAQSIPSNPWWNKPIHDQRFLKIVCVGAGASSLLFAYKLQRSFENFELTLYEKNEDIGGTWLENKYPGCACDVPAHAYTWSFEPNPNWSSIYAGSDEIHEYFSRFTDKYGLRKYCQFKKSLSRAEWNDEKGQWSIEVTDLATGNTIHDWCHFLINGGGVLNSWKWPNIPGIDTFEGDVLHTAKYDRSLDLTDKIVALIGTGSSGVQVLPAILPKVKKVVTFNRSATWVLPTQAFQQRYYTPEEKESFASDPKEFGDHRRDLETRLHGLFPLFVQDSPLQKALASTVHGAMTEKLKGSGLEDKVIPTWSVGCRRLTPGVGYLEALVHEKTEVVTTGVKKITAKGLVSEEDKEYSADVIICATGFSASFVPSFPVIGSGGKLLAEAWKDEPINYLGLSTPEFPNYFMLPGPNSPLGTGPFLIVLEAQADYALKFINRYQTENIHSISPKLEAAQELMQYKDTQMKRMVWDLECPSWYKKGSSSGKITALWGGSSLHYLETISEPRYEDFNFSYNGNRFAYLGNGFSQTEKDMTADWSYYLRDVDDGPLLGRAKHRRVVTKSGTVERSQAELNGTLKVL